MATSSKPNHVRSISLPGRSHPITERVEEALNNLKTSEISTSGTMYNGLLSLEELYKCMNDLLNLPQTFNALSGNQQGKWVEDILDKSVKLLDLCGNTRELVLKCKENVRDLQFSLRRRKTDSTIEANVNRFTSFSKKTKKEAKRLVIVLKQMDKETETFQHSDHETIAVIRVLREANVMSIYIFQILLTFLSAPLLKTRSSKWSLVSRLVSKGKIACGSQEEKMDLETRLESFEDHLDNFENGLEGIFRSLIRTRSSLLNIFSC